jgi:hypothetical protein
MEERRISCHHRGLNTDPPIAEAVAVTNSTDISNWSYLQGRVLNCTPSTAGGWTTLCRSSTTAYRLPIVSGLLNSWRPCSESATWQQASLWSQKTQLMWQTKVLSVQNMSEVTLCLQLETLRKKVLCVQWHRILQWFSNDEGTKYVTIRWWRDLKDILAKLYTFYKLNSA